MAERSTTSSSTSLCTRGSRCCGGGISEGRRCLGWTTSQSKPSSLSSATTTTTSQVDIPRGGLTLADSTTTTTMMVPPPQLSSCDMEVDNHHQQQQEDGLKHHDDDVDFLTKRVSELESRLLSNESDLKQALEANTNLNTQLCILQGQNEELTHQLSNERRKVPSLTTEVEELRRQLAAEQAAAQQIRQQTKTLAGDFRQYVLDHGPKGEDLPLAWAMTRQRGLTKHQDCFLDIVKRASGSSQLHRLMTEYNSGRPTAPTLLLYLVSVSTRRLSEILDEYADMGLLRSIQSQGTKIAMVVLREGIQVKRMEADSSLPCDVVEFNVDFTPASSSSHLLVEGNLTRESLPRLRALISTHVGPVQQSSRILDTLNWFLTW